MARMLRLALFAYTRVESLLVSYKCGTRAACYPNLLWLVESLFALFGG